MTLAFTICSINYLAQAKTLGESLRTHHPEFRFVIGLVDRLEYNTIDEAELPPDPLLEIHQISIQDFEWMCENYDITELNTAVKPYFIDYFFSQYSDIQNVIYFDPDIIVYRPLDRLLLSLGTSDIVVTPHITVAPPNDGLMPTEHIHLSTGIFNLGFIALHRSDNSQQFVDWWKRKLAKECKIDLCNGLFVDQNWVNFAPFYFDKVLVERHVGYNVAYWNLHERSLSQHDGHWMVNGDQLLYFFHYSGYQLAKPEQLSKYQNRYDFETRPDVWPLFEWYANRLAANGNTYFAQFKCAYIKPQPVYRYQRVRRLLKRPFLQLKSHLEGQ